MQVHFLWGGVYEGGNIVEIEHIDNNRKAEQVAFNTLQYFNRELNQKNYLNWLNEIEIGLYFFHLHPVNYKNNLSFMSI